MSSLVSTDPIDALARLDERILGCLDALDAALLRNRTERNLLLFGGVVSCDLVDHQLPNWNERRALIRDGGILKVFIWARNVRVDGKDNRLAREPLLEVILQVARPKVLERLVVFGIEVDAVCRLETVPHIGDFAIFVGQDVSVGLVVRDSAIVVGIRLLRGHEPFGGFVRVEEDLECSADLLQDGQFLGGVATAGLGLFVQGLGNFDGSKHLEEAQEVLAVLSRKPVEGVVDEICVRVLVDLEANGEALGSGAVCSVGDVRDAAANREASRHWSRAVVEVSGCGEGLGLLRWRERSLDQEAFGVGYANNELSI